MTAYSNRLPALAAEIRTAHAEIHRGAKYIAERALAAGKMLTEARRLVPHGDWAAWLTEHVGFSDRSARRYMKLERTGNNSATVAELGIKAAAVRVARIKLPIPTGNQTLHIQTPTGQAFVWPSTEHDGFCWVLAFATWPAGAVAPELNSSVVSLVRPVRGGAVATVLSQIDLRSDAAVARLNNNYCHEALAGLSALEPDVAVECLALAAITRPDFERAVSDAKKKGEELTAAAIILAARSADALACKRRLEGEAS